MEGKNILVFDLETTGFPKKKPGFNIGVDEYYNFKENDKYNDARIVQIAWCYIEDFNVNKLEHAIVESYIRKPLDFSSISNDEIHRITFKVAKSKGTPLSKIIRFNGFGDAIEKVDYIIGHNVLYDVFILLNELHRIKFNNAINKIQNLLKEDKVICTGELGRNICQIPMERNKFFKYKMPQLKDLYKHYFGMEPKVLHDAEADVRTLLSIVEKIFTNKSSLMLTDDAMNDDMYDDMAECTNRDGVCHMAEGEWICLCDDYDE
jgi:DNA polymerase III epsilon subunit-like protein